jgi:hypothetical protein
MDLRNIIIQSYIFLMGSRLVEMFLDVAMRQHNTISVPKSIAKIGATLWSAPLAFPIMTADEVERVISN